jgi:hypothetical protein
MSDAIPRCMDCAYGAFPQHSCGECHHDLARRVDTDGVPYKAATMTMRLDGSPCGKLGNLFQQKDTTK